MPLGPSQVLLLEVWDNENVGFERPSSPKANAQFVIPGATTSVAYPGVPGGSYTFYPVDSAGIRLVIGSYWLVVRTSGFPAHHTASGPFPDEEPVVVVYESVLQQEAGVWGPVGTTGTTLVGFSGCTVEPGETCASELSMFTLPSVSGMITDSLLAQKFYTHSNTRLLSASIGMGGFGTELPTTRYTHNTHVDTRHAQYSTYTKRRSCSQVTCRAAFHR